MNSPKPPRNPPTFSSIFGTDPGEAIELYGTGPGIEAQESAGQALFLKASTLPISIMGGSREQFGRMGLVFGEPVDDLFVSVKFPPGWSKVANVDPLDPYPYTSYLLDEKGRRRAQIHYQPALHHREASAVLLTRYRTELVYCDAEGKPLADMSGDYRMMAVMDGDTVVHHAPIRACSDKTSHRQEDRVAVETWIREHLLHWEDPLAYWDSERSPEHATPWRLHVEFGDGSLADLNRDDYHDARQEEYGEALRQSLSLGTRVKLFEDQEGWTLSTLRDQNDLTCSIFYFDYPIWNIVIASEEANSLSLWERCCTHLNAASPTVAPKAPWVAVDPRPFGGQRLSEAALKVLVGVPPGLGWAWCDILGKESA